MLKTLSYIPSVYKNQYRPPTTLKKFQEKRLRYIVDFAYKNTRLYKEKFKQAGIAPADIKTLDDMTKIPLITKDEIKAGFFDKSVAPGYTERTCVVKTTSGTSGNVITIFINPQAHQYMSAVVMRDHLAQGVRPWHRFYVLYHDPVELEKASRNFFYRVKGVSGVLPEKALVEEAKKYQPDVMGGHPSAYVAMATHIENNGIEEVHPRLILVGGEIAYPEYRDYIERVFQCQTLNKYGAYETYSIAWECSHHSMHMNIDSILVEFVKDGEPVAAGERGEILITNLWNEAMPFIRYRIGDIGVPSDKLCECGRTLPVMENLEGRADDFIVLPSGRAVPPTRLIPPFFMTPYVEEFKMIQETKTRIRIQIVARKKFTSEDTTSLLEKIRDVLQEPVDIEVEHVEEIEQTKSGKFKAVMSKVPLELAS